MRSTLSTPPTPRVLAQARTQADCPLSSELWALACARVRERLRCAPRFPPPRVLAQARTQADCPLSSELWALAFARARERLRCAPRFPPPPPPASLRKRGPKQTVRLAPSYGPSRAQGCGSVCGALHAFHPPPASLRKRGPKQTVRLAPSYGPSRAQGRGVNERTKFADLKLPSDRPVGAVHPMAATCRWPGQYAHDSASAPGGGARRRSGK